MTTRHPSVSALLCAIVVAGASAFVAAQAQPRVMYVSAVDQAGAPVSELSPDDISIREDDVAREVLRIEPARDPLQVALMVDNSTAAEPFIRDYRQALPEFVNEILSTEQAGARNELALIALAERPTILTNYTFDRAEVLKGIQRIFAMPQSGTYMLDGIIEVSEGIMKRAAPRPTIVAVLTDGPELSQRAYQRVLEPLRASGAAFHVVLVGNPRNDQHDRAMVLDLGSKETGGTYETLLTGTALPQYMRKLATQLTHQFKVTYARPPQLIPPKRITISTSRSNLEVRGVAERTDTTQDRR